MLEEIRGLMMIERRPLQSAKETYAISNMSLLLLIWIILKSVGLKPVVLYARFVKTLDETTFHV
ncbi:hypothetical protein BOW11_13225 [Solemya velum gill symbiont]|nr:hypothetical protein BOW11_13225 [Solemya velum gill symbiont]